MAELRPLSPLRSLPRPIGKLLLDTCTFLWLTLNAKELSRAARKAFADPDNEVFLSSVSAWEIGIKHRLGKLPLPEAPSDFVPKERNRHGIDPLPLTEVAALTLGRLPDLHRDPFDRMLVSQAIVGGLSILTPDPLIQQYPVMTLWQGPKRLSTVGRRWVF